MRLGETFRALALSIGATVLLAAHLWFLATLVASALPYLPDLGLSDFTAFWAAAKLALAGEASAAYDVELLNAAIAKTFPLPHKLYWFYPPTFLLAMTPFALLPHGPALLVWLGLSFLAMAAAIWALTPPRIVPRLAVPVLTLLFAGTGFNLMFGQNGMLMAAMLGAILLWHDERPVLAGIALAVLAMKPPLAAPAVLALLAGGHYRALLWGMGAAAGLALASLTAFGPEPWILFFETLPMAGDLADEGQFAQARMPTIVMSLRKLGIAPPLAQAAQAITAMAALTILIWNWRADRRPERKAAILALAICLATPYLHHYDYALLAVPAMMLAFPEGRHARRDWPALFMFWLVPLGSWSVEVAGGPPTAPFLLAFLLGRLAFAAWREAL